MVRLCYIDLETQGMENRDFGSIEEYRKWLAENQENIVIVRIDTGPPHYTKHPGWL